MAQESERSRGRPQNYKLDRGGVPAEPGPFIGTRSEERRVGK
jgi:hypothetical protein